VKASEQAIAKKQLSATPFKSISRQEAERFLRRGETVSSASHLYLVRASSFNIDTDYNLKRALDVLVYPENKILWVVDESFSQPEARPINFAIVVETDVELQDVDVICLSAA
jgi:hypothetical protein